MDLGLVRALRQLGAAESGAGTRAKDAPLHLALVYPSPYRAAMSSLGFLQIHRLAHARPLTRVERATLPEPSALEIHQRTRTPLLTIESARPVGDAHLIGFSQAYELELAGVVTALELAGLSPLAADRSARDPLVVLGGPITFSNPLPSAPFADLLLLGEAEQTFTELLDLLERRPEAARGSETARRALLEELAGRPGFYVPALEGEQLPAIAAAPDALLPAHSEIWSPNTELADMVLVEPERGCHRGCTFCVMRRSTNGGMRLVPPARVLEQIPAEVPKVGLVGAAVSDHPRITEILRAIVEGMNKQVGISSLRADRLDDEFVGLLARGGYRSMTVALDAASVRLRDAIEKNLKERHVERAVALAKAHGMRHLKIYVIIGLPDETDSDLDELLLFSERLSAVLPVKLAVSPFVPKWKTPLALAPFAGEPRAAELIHRLVRRSGRRVEIRGPSAKEAYVEYRLAQGGHAHAQAAIAAAHAGASLNAWKRALAELPERIAPPNPEQLVPLATPRRRALLHPIVGDPVPAL
jgi:radical SAM superfamily enzyme YgiQ (UPF0313 family)